LRRVQPFYLYKTGNEEVQLARRHPSRPAHIAALYLIEKEIKWQSANERRAVRTTRARPLFDGMRRWLERALAQLAPKSETAAAIHYVLDLWDALARYLDDGRIELTT
jgi:hypothetical protein